MDAFLLLLLVLVLCVLAGVLLLLREVRRLRKVLASGGREDPCRSGFEMRMRCVERRLQDLDRRL